MSQAPTATPAIDITTPLTANNISSLSLHDLEFISQECFFRFPDHVNQIVFQNGVLAGEELIRRCHESNDDMGCASCHDVLSQHYMSKFDLQKVLADLESAIEHSRSALGLVPESERERNPVMMLDFKLELLQALEKRYDRFVERQTKAALDELIELGRNVVALNHAQGTITINLGVYAHNLGLRLHARYRSAGGSDKRTDLEEAVAYQREALSVVERCNAAAATAAVTSKTSASERPFQAEYIIFQVELSKKLQALHEITRTPESIAEATQLMEFVIAATSPEHANYCTYLNLLSTRLRSCAVYFGCLIDFEKAIQTARECLRISPTDHASQSERIGNLANAYFVRFEKLNSHSDFQCAKKYTDEALAAGGTENAPPVVLWTAATHYSGFYEKTGDIDHINKAITYREVAVNKVPTAHPFGPGILSNQGSDLLLRYGATGNISDLHQAIHLSGKAMDLVAERNSVQKLIILSNLSSALATRYQRIGSLWDLHHSTEYAREALNAIPFYHVEVRFLNNLANVLFLKYRRQGLLEDLDAAIDVMNRGLQSTQQLTQQDRLTLIANLIAMLRVRALTDQQPPASNHDLLRAKFLCRYAIHLTPKGSRNRFILLGALANILQLQATTSSSYHDNTLILAQALKVSQEAAKAVQAEPERASILIGLGNIHCLMSERRHPQSDEFKSDLENGIVCYLEALASNNTPPLKRIQAATFAVDLLVPQHDWQRSKLAVESALQLIPFANPRSLSRADQQFVLSQVSGLSALGCSIVLDAGGNAADALRVLENGRGIMLGNTIRIGSANNVSDPALLLLLGKYDSLRSSLDQKAVENIDLSKISSQFEIAAGMEDLEALLVAIRKFPGYGNFQAAPSIEEIQKAASDGPIVAVISTKLRSDAIIITSSEVSVLKLPNVRHLDVEFRARLLTKDIVNFSLQTLRHKNDQFREQMSWLWTAVVSPIIRHLQLKPQGCVPDLPRLRWIGVGAFGVFPFHAAGDHLDGSDDNTLSYAISSYSPTLRSIVSASQTNDPRVNLSDYGRMLFVGMPKTKQLRELPEIKHLPQRLQKLEMDVQTIEKTVPRKVLESLTASNVLLCACHGINDNRNPTASYLALDASESHDAESNVLLDANAMETFLQSIDSDGRLSVQAISYFHTIQPKGKLPALVFLMACSTAATTSLELSDEALHMAAAFHLIGCKDVIGTLWNSIQSASVSIVVQFFTNLQRQANFKTAQTSIASAMATALHQAMLEERRQNPKLLLRWAPFVHFGS